MNFLLNTAFQDEKHTNKTDFIMTATIHDFKLASQQCEYRNFAVQILSHARSTLSRCAQITWEFLFTAAYFKQDWKLTISQSQIGAGIGRTVRTVNRILYELESKGYLRRWRKHRQLFVQVLAPQTIVDNMLRKPARRSARSIIEPSDIFVTRQLPPPLNINNNINNNRDSQVNAPNHVPVSTPVVVNFSDTLEKYQQQKEKLEQEFTEICRQIIKNPDKRSELYDQQKKIADKMGMVRIKIMQITQHIKNADQEKNKNCSNYNHSRRLTPHDWQRLQKAIGRQQGGEKIIDEIAYSVVEGQLSRGKTTSHGVSIALKLYRENRWTTPANFKHGGQYASRI